MHEDLVCDDCGETGRAKFIRFHGHDGIGYYCHDEEKSCYIYVVMKDSCHAV